MRKLFVTNNKLPVILLLFAVISLFLWKSGRRNTLVEFKETRQYFGAYVTIHCFYAPRTDIDKIIKQCWQRLEEIRISMNALSAVGYVARINESGYFGVKVNDDVYNLIKGSIEFSQLTHGAFDITVFPLIEMWKEAQKSGDIPDTNIIERVKDKIGYQYIKLEKDNMVYLKKTGMKIDLGAIAKGYAVDEIASILAQNRIKNFLIDAGGDLYVSGRNANKEFWKIGVQDPQDKEKIIDTLKLSNMAVTTSGDYERFYTIDNKRYSHIIDPITGYPQENVISATVIAPTAKEADAYSTALCVLGAKKGIALINRTKNVEAMIIELIKNKPKTYKTKGYDSYL